MRWFNTKSQLCRELEVKAIRDFLVIEAREPEDERDRRKEEDRRWMEVLAAETAPPSPVSDSRALPDEAEVRGASQTTGKKKQVVVASQSYTLNRCQPRLSIVFRCAAVLLFVLFVVVVWGVFILDGTTSLLLFEAVQ